MNAGAEERSGPDQADADAAAGQRDASTAAAIVRLFATLRHSVIALVALVAAEARVLRASIAVIVLAGVALIALAVSLWACVVALIGWALVVASGSIGIALAILVVLHLVLVIATWLAIKRAIHHAGFPHARAEFGAMRRSLQRDLTKFQRTAPPAPEPESPP